ncbi:MAG: hypothetical protein CYPHOPRED_003757 [Cyphobasidiales sp. Tagirdzhanova-0007]|nr:MAG: hypothetical protein CYPHOPRED_003757 [Cyphobasidiales sp. Tagirdzhanova-0007]
MRAWVWRSQGHPHTVLKLDSNYPTPVPTTAFPIVVKIHAVGLNPIGWKQIKAFPSVLVKKPAVPESDFSGVVAAVLPGLQTDFKVGNEVFGMMPQNEIFKSGRGVLAEYALAPLVSLAHKPPSLSFPAAACVTLAAETVYQGLVTKGKIKSGDRVLINGASGGVGIFAVQLAKHFGATVVATCSARSRQLVQSLGADEASLIDYQAVDLSAHLAANYSKESAFHLILDTIGTHSLFYASASFMKANGVYVDNGADFNTLSELLFLIFHFARKSFWPFPRVAYKRVEIDALKQGPDLVALAELIRQDKIRVIIDSIHDFDRAHDAYSAIMPLRAKGKVVIQLADN